MQYAAIAKERDGRILEKQGTMAECLEWIERVREKAGTIDVEMRAIQQDPGEKQ